MIKNTRKDTKGKLQERISLIEKYFDIDRIIKPYQDANRIKDYYQRSHFAYLSLISGDGFMQMGISRDGNFKNEDLHAQWRFVNSYIKKIKAKKVLELGCGNGSNSAALARINKNVLFFGLDLSKNPLFRFRNIKNYKHERGNYHDLSRYEDESFDVVFAIET